MSLDRFYTETFYLIEEAAGASFPYQLSASTCTAFNGAIDQVGSQERLIAGNLTDLTTHVILCPTSVAITSDKAIRYGTRYFKIVSRSDLIPLRPGHHQEVMVAEVASDGV